MGTVRPLFALAAALFACGGCAAAGPEKEPSTSAREDPKAASLDAPAHLSDDGAGPPRRPSPPRPRDLPPRPHPKAPPRDLALLHGPCPAQGCPEGMQCLSYCGVAGCRPGSVLQSCEIPCKSDAQCPEGLGCGRVVDGPGRVCLGSGSGEGPSPRGGDLW